MSNKYLAHIDRDQTLKVFRTFLRKYKIASTVITVGGGGFADSLFLGGNTSWHGGAVATPETTTGYDFSTEDVDDSISFRSYAERWLHWDTYCGRPITVLFRGQYTPNAINLTDGHTHSNNDDGDFVQALNILAPVGSVGGDTTLAAHLKNSLIHLLGGLPSKILGIFTTFDIVNNPFRTTHGTATIDTLTASNRLCIEDDSVVRLKTSELTWSDAFIVEYDVAFASGGNSKALELRLKVSDDLVESPHALICRISGTPGLPSCVMIENMNNNYTERITLDGGDGIVSTLAYTRIRLVYCGQRIYQWVDVGHRNICQWAIVQYTTAGDGVLKMNGGYVEIAVPKNCEHAYIDNFAIIKLPPLDASDLTDYTDLFTSIPITAHAGTHSAGGQDSLDVSYLADSDDRMLTSTQKTRLFNNPDQSNMHYHTDKEIVFAIGQPLPVVDDDIDLYDHVHNVDIHDASAAVSNRKIPFVHAMDTYNDGTLQENKAAGTILNGTARADHSHIPMPFWEITVDYTLVPDSWATIVEHCCDSSYIDSSSMSEFSPVAEKFQPWYTRSSLPKPIRYFIPSMCGELSFRYATLRGFQGNISQLSPINHLPHCLFRYRVWNGGTSFVKRAFIQKAKDVHVWVTIRNSDTSWEITPYPGIYHAKWEDGARTDVVEITFAHGYNDIYVYVFPLSVNTEMNFRYLNGASGYNPGSLFSYPQDVHFISPVGENPLTWWNSVPADLTY